MSGEVTLAELLSSSVVTKAISTIDVPNNRLQKWFGMQPGGVNNSAQMGRNFGWDIFDHTRSLAKGRAPASGPSTTAANPVGHVQARAYRSHEKIHLDMERIYRSRPLGSSWGTVDTRGQKYILSQQKFLAQLFSNTREFMISRMLRGGFGVRQDGDNFIPVELDAGIFNVDYQLPASNKDQLDLEGGGDLLDTTWENAAAGHMTQITNIDAAFQRIHGMPLTDVWLNNATIAHLFNSNELASVAGTANVIFDSNQREGITGPDGRPKGDRRVVFKAMPFITFHVYDSVLVVDGTSSATFPDNRVSFNADPSSTWAEWYEGSEMVLENVVAQMVERIGFAAWTELKTQPAGYELLAVDNGIPALFIPKATAYGTVVF